MGTQNRAEEIAYRKVYGITATEAKMPEHQARIKGALEAVWLYDKLLNGEDEVGKEIRLEMTTPATGEYAELAAYLKELPGNDDIAGMMAKEAVFTIYKKMEEAGLITRMNNTGENANVDDSATGITDMNEAKSTVDSDKEKMPIEEEKTMASNEAVEKMKELEKSIAGGMGADVETSTGAGNLPEVDDITLKAAGDLTKDNEKERIATSQTAAVEQFIVTSVPGIERAVDRENAMGTVEKAPETFKKFVEKVGAMEADGTVIFSNCPQDPVSLKEVKEVYEVLEAAAEGCETPIQASISDSIGAIKGYRIVLKKGDRYQLMDRDEMTHFIFKKTLGTLNTTDPGAQVTAQVARATNGKNKSGKRAGQATKSVGALASVRLNGRKAAVEAGLFTYIKTPDKAQKQILRGFKSKMSCPVYSKKLNDDGTKKVIRYHIPLMVEQYVLTSKDKELVAKFPERTGVGTVKIVNLSDAAVAQEQLKAMSESISKLLTMGAKGGIFDDLRKRVDQAGAADTFAQNEDVPK